MTVDAALFVSNVTQDGGQPNLTGLFAGFRAITFPHQAQFGFFIQVELTAEEAKETHEVHFEFRDSEANVLAATTPVVRKPEPNPHGFPMKMVLAFKMNAEIPASGVYKGCVIVDGNDAAETSLCVIEA